MEIAPQQEFVQYDSHVRRAINAYQAGRLLEWQIDFLNSRGDNPCLANELERLQPDLDEPVLMDLDDVHRVIGPGPRPIVHEEPCDFYANVERCQQDIESGGYPGPLLAAKCDQDWTFLLDGNHTKMALKRLGFESWWIVVARHSELKYEPKS